MKSLAGRACSPLRAVGGIDRTLEIFRRLNHASGFLLTVWFAATARRGLRALPSRVFNALEELGAACIALAKKTGGESCVTTEFLMRGAAVDKYIVARAVARTG